MRLQVCVGSSELSLLAYTTPCPTKTKKIIKKSQKDGLNLSSCLLDDDLIQQVLMSNLALFKCFIFHIQIP